VNLVREAGSDGIFVKTDVADEVSVRSLMEKTVRSYGRLDYAFNNAGVEQTMTPLVEQTVEEFDQMAVALPIPELPPVTIATF
jgi:NAD(P)-dependent dehydrogenase (short-subunit alcohol dehydrogenase family)